MWQNPLVNTFFLNLAMVCLGVNLSILGYLSLYGPFIKGVDLDMERDTPQLIPVMTICGLGIFLCTLLAMWPLYHIFTPIYLLIMFFGSSLSMTFLPNGNIGSLVFWIVFLAGGWYAHNMEQEAVW